MENKNNSLIKDALILFLITVIAGLALGFVNQLTKGPIEQQKISALKETYQEIFAAANDFGYNDTLDENIKKANEALPDQAFGNVTVDEVVEAKDSSGSVIGYIISATSKDGYNGDISVAVGIDTEGAIINVAMIEISETVGLGMKAADADFKDQYIGKDVSEFVVVKGGKSADNEIDAISGATITSSAVTNAVNAVLYYANNYMER